jgi:hypothetical protein
MLQLKFIKKAAGLMRAAVDEAKITGNIFNTQWREINGELYFRIPDEEVDPWLELLSDLALDANEDYQEIYDQIKAMRDEDPWQSISSKPASEVEKGKGHGFSSDCGAADSAAGESSGGDS